MKNSMLRATLLAALALATVQSIPASAFDAPARDGFVRTASATPTPRQIEDAIRAENWNGAESMLNDVLREKPNSAKAWYWMAQTQEKLGNSGKAKQALSKAEQIQPDMKFASPGAVSDMHARLGQSTALQARPPQRPMAQTQPIPGYGSRTAVGETQANKIDAPNHSSSHAWIYILLVLVAGGLGIWYYMNKRSKREGEDALQRERLALLGRANSAQERATALAKTARFESQESSLFGVAAAGLVSRANSALSRLKSINATFDASHERVVLDGMEAELEALENQAARKAWSEAPVVPTVQIQAQDPSYVGQGMGQPAGFGQSYNSGYNPGQPMQGPQTVVVNQGNSGSGLLETMIIADALGHNHGHSDREYDLERENRRLRDQQSGQQGYSAPAPTAPERSSFDLGSGGGSGWDNNAPASTPDNSTWDNSSTDSSSDSSSSDSSSDSSGGDSW